MWAAPAAPAPIRPVHLLKYLWFPYLMPGSLWSLSSILQLKPCGSVRDPDTLCWIHLGHRAPSLGVASRCQTLCSTGQEGVPGYLKASGGDKEQYSVASGVKGEKERQEVGFVLSVEPGRVMGEPEATLRGQAGPLVPGSQIGNFLAAYARAVC